MQSVFGLHDRTTFSVFCYATTPSDKSPYREKIEREAEHFRDVSAMSNQQVVEQIVADGIHVLCNLCVLCARMLCAPVTQRAQQRLHQGGPQRDLRCATEPRHDAGALVVPTS
jgi:predicted O-linked N-acetylglucosamine transferase (SPINDLY family)